MAAGGFAMRLFLQIILAFLATGGAAMAQTIDLSATTIVDLSHAFDSETIH